MKNVVKIKREKQKVNIENKVANNNKKIKYETMCELVSQPNSIGGTAYQSTNKTKQNKTK